MGEVWFTCQIETKYTHTLSYIHVCTVICLSAYFQGVETAAYLLVCAGCSLASLQRRLLFGCSFLILPCELTTGHQSRCWTWKWVWGKSEEQHKPDWWEVTHFAFSSAEVSNVLSFSPKFYLCVSRQDQWPFGILDQVCRQWKRLFNAFLINRWDNISPTNTAFLIVTTPILFCTGLGVFQLDISQLGALL